MHSGPSEPAHNGLALHTLAMVQQPAPSELTGILDDRIRSPHVEPDDVLKAPGQLAVELLYIAGADERNCFLDESHIESN